MSGVAAAGVSTDAASKGSTVAITRRWTTQDRKINRSATHVYAMNSIALHMDTDTPVPQHTHRCED